MQESKYFNNRIEKLARLFVKYNLCYLSFSFSLHVKALLNSHETNDAEGNKTVQNTAFGTTNYLIWKMALREIQHFDTDLKCKIS